MSDVQVLDMPVELNAKLRAVICLNGLHSERQPREHIIYEVTGVLLVVPLVYFEHAQAGAVINGRILPVAFTLSRNGCEELGVNLQPMSGKRLFITAPLLMLWLMSLVLWQTIKAMASQDAIYRLVSNHDLVVAQQIQANTPRTMW